MAYIQSTNISNEKGLFIALRQIYGIGKTGAKQICDKLGLSPQISIQQIKQNQIEQLNTYLSREAFIGQQLRRTYQFNLQRLVTIGSYRGFRFTQGLPSRGQRTHGNARTVKKLKQTTKTFKEATSLSAKSGKANKKRAK